MTASPSQSFSSVNDLVLPGRLDEIGLANIASNFATLASNASVEQICLRGSADRFLTGIDLDFFRQCLVGKDWIAWCNLQTKPALAWRKSSSPQSR